MNEIQIFSNPSFGEIRTMVIDNEPWFVGKDVAKALKYKDASDALKRHVDSDDKGVGALPTPGGKQKMTIINEPGLYSLILSSKLPTAKEFKRWVTHDVIPSIRKNGGYIAGQEQLSESELMAKALIVAHNTIKLRDQRIKALEAEKSELLAENTIMQPKADFFDALVNRNLLTNLRTTAQELGIGERAFIRFLLDNGYLYRTRKGRLMPKKEKNCGLFEIKETLNHKNGWCGTQTLVTPKGRETFRLLCAGL